MQLEWNLEALQPDVLNSDNILPKQYKPRYGGPTESASRFWCKLQSQG